MMQYLFLFCFGGLGYGALEILVRGYTHWSMVLTGGFCLAAFVYICRRFPAALPPVKAAAGAAIITLSELIVGGIVNVWLGWAVWDYSTEWGHVWGQICPKYTLYWFFLCLVLLDLAVIGRALKNRAMRGAFRRQSQ